MKQPKLETLLIMPINTHSLIKKLQKKQAFNEPQAEVLVETISEVVESQLVTKIELNTQIQNVRSDIQDLRHGMETQGKDLKAEIETQGKDLRAIIEAQGKDLRAEIEAQGVSLRAEIKDLRRDLESQGKELSAKIENQGLLFRTALENQQIISEKNLDNRTIILRAEIQEVKAALNKMGSDLTIRTAAIIITVSTAIEIIHRIFK